jgi:WD repeat-containing protein 70
MRFEPLYTDAGVHIPLRIWEVENKRKQKTVIVVKSKERGTRTKVNACAYSPDGNLIGGGEFQFQISLPAVDVLS